MTKNPDKARKSHWGVRKCPSKVKSKCALKVWGVSKRKNLSAHGLPWQQAQTWCQQCYYTEPCSVLQRTALLRILQRNSYKQIKVLWTFQNTLRNSKTMFYLTFKGEPSKTQRKDQLWRTSLMLNLSEHAGNWNVIMDRTEQSLTTFSLMV